MTPTTTMRYGFGPLGGNGRAGPAGTRPAAPAPGPDSAGGGGGGAPGPLIAPTLAAAGQPSVQPPAPLLAALLHRDCTANVPVLRWMSAAVPGPMEIQAHLSPVSAPAMSVHAVGGFT